MEKGILSKILDRFLIYLEVLPENLRLFCFSALFFFITIDTALVIYNNLGNDNFSYIEWGKKKILKVGFIMFALYKYEWLLGGVRNFFFYAVEKAIRTSVATGNYFNNPSYLVDKGIELSKYILNAVGVHPKTYIYLILSGLVYIGFIAIAIQLIICWIEYYFLTGFSIIFLPFGALDMGLEYYKNVFKAIISATIKLAVFSFLVSFSNLILDELFTLANSTSLNFSNIATIAGVIYVLMAIMTILPSLTSGLLTGSPAVNASAAMAGVGAGIAALGNKVKGAYHFGKGTFEAGKGAVEGAKTGAKLGAKTGLGVVGGAIGGTLGATVGGSYAGLKYYATKKGSDDEDNKDSKKNKTKENSKAETTETTTTKQDTTTNDKKSPSTNTNNEKVVKSETNTGENNQNTNNQSNNTSNSNTTQNTSTQNTTVNNNVEKNFNTKENLPDWAKEDYK